MPRSCLPFTLLLGATLLWPFAASADRRVDAGSRVVVTLPGIAHADLRRSWRIDRRHEVHREWRHRETRRERHRGPAHYGAGLPSDRVWRSDRHAVHPDFRPRRHVRHHAHAPHRHPPVRPSWRRWW
jgi:hypothetical protein